MLRKPHGRGWFLANTILVALLWVGAIFAFAGRSGTWALPANLASRLHVSPGADAALLGGTPALDPDLAGVPGLNLEPAELDATRLDGTLQRLDEAGIGWVRFRLPWDQAEPRRGQYAWQSWDVVFAALAQHPRLQPVVVLDGSPAWARDAQDAGNPLAPPHERADFGAFAAAVAGRYGDHVRYYQVWHEPNIAPHWGARPVDPLDYLGLLREAAVQIRAKDTDARIVLAALAPTTETGGANLSDISYLDALYQDGARAWFDVVAAEPYGFTQPPDAAAAAGTLNFGRVALLRSVMVRHGDAATPIWATAFGWHAPFDPGAHAEGSSLGQVTEDEQARYAAAALDQAATRWPWLGPLFWAEGCSSLPAQDPRAGLGVCTAAGSPRPVWQALGDAARRAPLLTAGEHPVDHPALRYSAGWRVTPSAADPMRDGETLSFDFYGTGLSLRVQGGPYWAFDRVTVDGQPANALPKDAAGAYLVLHDPLAAVRVVPVASGLPLGKHSVALQSTGGWGQWALQGLIVAAGPSQRLPGDWRTWAGLASLASLALIVLARPGRRPGVFRPRMATEAAWSLVARWSEAQLDRAAAWPRAVLWILAGLLALALAFSPWLVVDLAVLAALGLLFLVRPDLSLPLIALSIPLWPHPKPILRWGFTHYELFLWLGVLAAAGRCALHWLAGRTATPGGRQGGGRWKAFAGPRGGLGSLDWPVLALGAVGLISALAAAQRDVALREWRSVFLLGGLFYLLITRVPVLRGRVPPARRGGAPRPAADEPAAVQAALPRVAWLLLDGLLIGMVAVSLLALWQLVSGQGRVDVEGVWRVRAFYGSPNNLALALDRAVPLALAVALFGRANQARGWLARVRPYLYGGAAVVMGVACLATFSKGALLLGLPAGIGLVLIAGALRSGRRWPLWLLLAGVVAAAGVLAWLFQTPRFADLLNFQTGTSFFRVNLWQAALRMALDHPWLGVGPDNFLYAYRTRYVLPVAWQELNLSHPHNILLDLWTRLGLLGLAAGVWAFVAALRWGWRWFRTADQTLWPIALGLLGSLVATLAHGLIDNSLFLIDLMALFMLALGVLERQREV